MKKKCVCIFAFVVTAVLTFDLGCLSVLAETVSENQTSEERQQNPEMYEEAEFSLSGYCGREDENNGRNVTYTISDSNNDGIFDLLEIKGNGGIRESDIANPLTPGFGFEYVKNPLPWQIDDERMRLSKVVIGEGVTDIGYSCYRLWYLEEVSIPDSVTSISNYAFYGCVSLKEISIPDSVTLIQYGTFWNCDSLEKINIPDSVTSIRASVTTR